MSEMSNQDLGEKLRRVTERNQQLCALVKKLQQRFRDQLTAEEWTACERLREGMTYGAGYASLPAESTRTELADA